MKDYRYAISNLKLKDDVYEALVEDAINDIAIKSNFFKRTFIFDVQNGDDLTYDFSNMAYLAERNKYANTNEVGEDGSDTGSYINSFISVVDIIKIYSSNNDLRGSVMNKEFEIINGIEGIFKDIIRSDNDFRRYLCVYSYVPNAKYLYDRDESLIRNALIAKLKYDAYNLFYEVNDGAYIELLLKNYLTEINNLINLQQYNSILQSKNTMKGL